MRHDFVMSFFRRFIFHIPAALVIGALTAWAVADDPTESARHLVVRSSPRADALDDVVRHTRRYLSELQDVKQRYYERTRQVVEDRHAARGLDGEELRHAIGSDPEFMRLRHFRSGTIVVVKASHLWANELVNLARRLRSLPTAEEEDRVFNESRETWGLMADRGRGFVEETAKVVEGLGLEPPPSGPILLQAIRRAEKTAVNEHGIDETKSAPTSPLD